MEAIKNNYSSYQVIKSFFCLAAIGLFVLVNFRCEKEIVDFRLALVGNYNLERNCEIISAGIQDSVWTEMATAVVSIPTTLTEFEAANPEGYVPEGALPLIIHVDHEVSFSRHFAVWLSENGAFKSAKLDPHDLATGTFSETGLILNTSSGGLGSMMHCGYEE